MTTWRSMLEALPMMSEQEIAEALADERAGARRLSVMLRLHQRLGTLRLARERPEGRRLDERARRETRELDEVAYVRFASVYRDFREAKDFEAVLDGVVGMQEFAGHEMKANPPAQLAKTKKNSVRSAPGPRKWPSC
mgnify:CR=1 FL=1